MSEEREFVTVSREYLMELEQKAKDSEYLRGRVDGMEHVVDALKVCLLDNCQYEPKTEPQTCANGCKWLDHGECTEPNGECHIEYRNLEQFRVTGREGE